MKITSFLGVFFFPEASTGVASLKIFLFQKGQIFDLRVLWQALLVIFGFWVKRIDNRYIGFYFFSFSMQWDLVGHFISLPSVCLTISYLQSSAINFRCLLCLFFSRFILHALHILCFSLHYFIFYCQTLIWVFVFKSSDCCFLLLPNCYSLKKRKKKESLVTDFALHSAGE